MSEPELTLLIGAAAWMLANAIAIARLRRRRPGSLAPDPREPRHGS